MSWFDEECFRCGKPAPKQDRVRYPNVCERAWACKDCNEEIIATYKINSCEICDEPIPAGHRVVTCYYNGTHRGHGIQSINDERSYQYV